jgi:hypothetical protein
LLLKIFHAEDFRVRVYILRRTGGASGTSPLALAVFAAACRVHSHELTR